MRDAIRHGAVNAAGLDLGGEHTQVLDASGKAVRGRRSRVVPTPGVLASNLAVMWRPTGTRIDQRRGDGGNSATLPEESTKDTVKTIRAGKAGRSASPVIHPVCVFHAYGPRVPPAPGLPCALWSFERRERTAKLGRKKPRECAGVSEGKRAHGKEQAGAARRRENDAISSRAPHAAQRPFDDALQSRGPCIDRARSCWVPALRSSAKSAAARPGHGPLVLRRTRQRPGRVRGRAFSRS
ncbi:hypothetical protein ACVIIV_006569 [Bradyrhizobium sp. USDA 4354]